jgi:dipeptidase
MKGDLPPALGRGGEESSPDSPWWRFKELLTLVERDFERYGPPVREAWDRFESDTLRRAETIETEAAEMRRAGDSTAAANHLSRFMADNVSETLEQVEKLIRDQP